MLIHILLVIAGVAAVSFGAKILVTGASSLAKRLNVSDLVIGLTVVAFGTSAPELIVSVVAAAQGQPDVAIGNVIGSNIVNICVILGVSALIAPLSVHVSTIWKEIPLSLLGVIVAFLMAFDMLIDGDPNSVISRSDGGVLIAFFIIFLYYMLELARNSPEIVDTPDMHKYSLGFAILLVLGGLVGLTVGGKLIVDNAVQLARAAGISEAVIGLTLVAIGTSIPEFATSVAAAFQRKSDLAVGNIVGSNIFNIFFILGTSAIITPLPLGNIHFSDFFVCFLATVLLFTTCFVFKPRIIHKKEAVLFLLLYAGYMVYLFSNMD
jgi:cation:H+ antiporter